MALAVTWQLNFEVFTHLNKYVTPFSRNCAPTITIPVAPDAIATCRSTYHTIILFQNNNF